jgi:hypothetical protein
VQLTEIFPLNRKRLFNRESATAALAMIFRVTERHFFAVQSLERKHLSLQGTRNLRQQEVQQQIEKQMDLWQDQMRRLGAEPKGVWSVDLDFGQGYYCWKYPETELKFWHGYKDGFPGRKPIDAPRSV